MRIKKGEKGLAWLYLMVAGVFEIIWAIGLKYSEGFSRLYPSLVTCIGMILSLIFLSLALKEIPLGTAYAIWTGIGTVGAVILGIVLFHEPLDMIRIVCILLIIGGIVGLKLVSGH